MTEAELTAAFFPWVLEGPSSSQGTRSLGGFENASFRIRAGKVREELPSTLHSSFVTYGGLLLTTKEPVSVHCYRPNAARLAFPQCCSDGLFSPRIPSRVPHGHVFLGSIKLSVSQTFLAFIDLDR